jgi:hypothetical protein
MKEVLLPHESVGGSVVPAPVFAFASSSPSSPMAANRGGGRIKIERLWSRSVCLRDLLRWGWLGAAWTRTGGP